MKILLINNYGFKRGGTETVFLDTADLLKSKGHQVKLFSRFTLKDQNHLIDFSTQERSFIFNKFYSIRSKREIRNILTSFNPDVVHVNNIIGGITFSILPEIKKKNIPIVVNVHDFRMLCPVGIFINGKKEICEKCKVGKYYNCVINNCRPDGLLKNIMIATESYLRDYFLPHENFFDKYIFVSNFTKNKFLEFYPNLNFKSEVLYNFTTKFNKEVKRGKYFLFFGRLDREKGVKTLISVFKEMREFNLIILGKGEFENELLNFNLSNIKYLGFKKGKELQDLIVNSSFIIIPSECYETFGMSGAESLSMSKPIIASNLGGLTELVENETNGFIFEAGNKESLIAVIKKSINLTDEEYYKMCSNAFQFAQHYFNPEDYYKKLSGIYQSLIK